MQINQSHIESVVKKRKGVTGILVMIHSLCDNLKLSWWLNKFRDAYCEKKIIFFAPVTSSPDALQISTNFSKSNDNPVYKHVNPYGVKL